MIGTIDTYVPEDVAALCSRTRLDASRYKVFQRRRHGLKPPAPEERPTEVPSVTEAAPSRAPDRASAFEASPTATPSGPSAAPAFTPNPAPSPVIDQAGSRTRDAEIPVSDLRAMARLPLLTDSSGGGVSPDVVRRRWSILGELFEESGADNHRPYATRREARIPLISILSLAGGCGRTTIASHMAAALSLLGDRVLLVHDVQDDMTGCHFGTPVTRPGQVAVVSRDHGHGAVRILAYDEATEPSAEQASQWLSSHVTSLRGEVDRIIVQTKWSGEEDAAFLGLSGACIAVLRPDVKCISRLPIFTRWVSDQEQAIGRKIPVGYLLNKFDPEAHFHVDMRQWLRSELGDRLLPFAITRTDAVAEALGNGTTLIEYAPTSPVVDDFLRLAAWARDKGRRQRPQRFD